MTKARDIASATTPNANAALLATFPHRNLIINGSMQVAQRGTKVLTGNPEAGFACDRFEFYQGGDADVTLSQSTDAPSGSGFANSLKFDVVAADTSLAGGDIYVMRQKLEGQDLQSMKKGTSSAESVTMQFWIKSSKTGTYIVELYDIDNTRQISKSYTVSSANTWEHKTITFEGDTSGTFDNDNARSLDVQFWIASGSNFTSGTLSTTWTTITQANRAVGQVNALDNASNEIYITGVQLEVGDTATPFEHRSYGDELARCQRYYTSSFSGETTVGGSHPANYVGKAFAWCDHYGSSANRHAFNWNWPVQMRATPTITMYGNQWTSARVSKYNAGNAEYTISYSSGASRNGLAGYYQVGVSGDFVVAYVEAESEL